jgi:hypothetical protein
MPSSSGPQVKACEPVRRRALGSLDGRALEYGAAPTLPSPSSAAADLRKFRWMARHSTSSPRGVRSRQGSSVRTHSPHYVQASSAQPSVQACHLTWSPTTLGSPICKTSACTAGGSSCSLTTSSPAWACSARSDLRGPIRGLRLAKREQRRHGGELFHAGPFRVVLRTGGDAAELPRAEASLGKSI